MVIGSLHWMGDGKKVKLYSSLNYLEVIALCWEQEAKKSALLFDGVTIFTDESRAHQIYDELNSVHPEFLILFYPTSYGQYKAPEFLEQSNQTLSWLCEGEATSGYVRIPVYGSENDFNKECHTKDVSVYETILKNIPIIDEEGLTWEQVAEVRKAPELAKGFRDLRLWMSSLDESMSTAQFEDMLEQKIENYKNALKMNQIASINGTISIFTDPTKIITLSGVVAGANHLVGGISAALSGGLLLGSEVAVKVNEYLIGRNQVRDNYSEVAVLQRISDMAANK